MKYLFAGLVIGFIAAGSFVGGVLFAIDKMNDDLSRALNQCVAQKLELEDVVTVVECLNEM